MILQCCAGKTCIGGFCFNKSTPASSTCLPFAASYRYQSTFFTSDRVRNTFPVVESSTRCSLASMLIQNAYFEVQCIVYVAFPFVSASYRQIVFPSRPGARLVRLNPGGVSGTP